MLGVGIVVYDGVTLLDVSGPAEVFDRAGGYRVELLSPDGGEVRGSNGLRLAGTRAMHEPFALDVLVVAGYEHLPHRELPTPLLEAVARFVPLAERVASVCTGAFVLAALGLLDGRRATTHWRQADELAQLHPRVRVEAYVLHIADGPVWTSAGITAGVDLALSMVEEDLGAERAREVARELVVFLHRSGGQAQFSTALRTPVTTHERLRAVMDLVQADPAAPHGVESMARTASVSSRQLTRLFQRELGTTPARWLEQVRLDHAKQLLLDGHSVTDSAQLSGFGSDETLRRAFWRHLHTTPSEYREHFATSSGRVPGHLEAVSGSGTDVGARPAQS